MAITVGRIDNKFWDNSSYKQPNAFPVYDKQQFLDKTRPSLNSFISGDIYLKGGDWNHCLYEGAYYALKILRILDPKKDLYHYRLERELWFDVLKANARVMGDLTTSSDEVLLSEHIHKTIGVLDNPTRVTTINFKLSKDDGPFYSTEVKEITADLRQDVVGVKTFRSFVDKINTPYKGSEVNDLLYAGIRNPGIFILGRLDAETRKIEGGKERVKDKINKFLKDLDSNKEKLRISKVTIPTESKLIGNYAVTGKTDGIGNTEEKYSLPLIDLSALEDIVSINSRTLEVSTPTTPLDLRVTGKGGLFDGPEWADAVEHDYVGKIASISYTPINEGGSTVTDAVIPALRGTTGKGTKPPQEVHGSYKGKEGLATLGWKDNLNGLYLKEDSFRYSYTGSLAVGADGEINSDIYKEELLGSLTHIDFATPFISTTSKDNVFNSTWHKASITTAYGDYTEVDPFWDVGKNEPVSVGFLIYQLNKNTREGNRFEYQGDIALTSLTYASGISNSFFDYYSQSDNYGYELRDDYYRKKNLARIQPEGADVFVRAYLDNYWTWWLGLLPQPIRTITQASAGYGYALTSSYQVLSTYDTMSGGPDYYGLYYYRAYADTTAGQIRRDINWGGGGHTKDYRKAVEVSPLRSEEAYREFKDRKGKNLSSKLLGSNLDLKPDFRIQKGDYFFSDLEYTIKKYDQLIFPNSAEHPGLLASNQTNVPNLKKVALLCAAKNEDNIMSLPEKTPDKGLFLCTRRDGKLDLRILKTFEETLTLSTNENQTVLDVNSDTKRKTKFFLLRPQYVFDTLVEPSDDIKKQILRDTYELLGYPVSSRKPDPSVGKPPTPAGLGYSNEDLEKGQLLFDLTNTNGYCFLDKGNVHLIAKSPKVFKPQSISAKRLDHESNKKYTSVEDPEKPMSLIERVNQKVQFRFLTASYDLNGKSNFDSKDQLSLDIEQSKAKDIQKVQDYFFVSLDSKYDVIWGETISVPKKSSDEKVKAIASGIELERFNLNLLNSHRMLEANQGRYLLSEKRINENQRRAQKQLEIQKMQADLNFGTGLISALAGSGHEYFYGARASRRSLRGKGLDLEERQLALMEDSPFAGLTAQSFLHGSLNVLNKGSSMAKVIGNYAIQRAHIFPERQERINMDKKLASEQLALQSLQFNTKHMNEQLDAQLELNRIFSRYDLPSINDTDINEEFRTNEKLHGKQLGEAHLVIYTPSAEQMVYLREYVEEYGIGCDIPDIEYGFYSGMKPGIIRYRNLEDLGIRGITNVAVREYIKGRLTAGVKVVEIGKGEPEDSCLTLGQFKALLSAVKGQFATEQGELKTEISTAIDAIDATAKFYNFDLDKWQSLEAKLKKFFELLQGHIDTTKDDKKKEALDAIKTILGLPPEATEAEIESKLNAQKNSITGCDSAKEGLIETLNIPKDSDGSKVKDEVGQYKTFRTGVRVALGDKVHVDSTNHDLMQELDSQIEELKGLRVTWANAKKYSGAPANYKDSDVLRAIQIGKQLGNQLATFDKAVRPLINLDPPQPPFTDFKDKTHPEVIKRIKAFNAIKDYMSDKAPEGKDVVEGVKEAINGCSTFKSELRTIVELEQDTDEALKTAIQTEHKELKAGKEEEQKIKDQYSLPAITVDSIKGLIQTEVSKGGSGLKCAELQSMLGHTEYDLSDNEVLKHIRKLCYSLAITIRYMLSQEFDQRFSGNRRLQPVFKVLYEIAEHDLVQACLDTFPYGNKGDADYGEGRVMSNFREEEGESKRDLPVVKNHERLELNQVSDGSIFWTYGDSNSNGRLFKGTDRDIFKAVEVIDHGHSS